MTIKIYDSSFDESHGWSPEEASKLIPRVELEKPVNDAEVIFATYWQHIRKCQLMQKEYQISPTETNLKILFSLLYEAPPPYDITWLPKHYRKQAEHLELLRQGLIMVKPFQGVFENNELKEYEEKYCSLCNHKGLIAHETSKAPRFIANILPEAAGYIDQYWCPNCNKVLLPSQTYGEPR